MDVYHGIKQTMKNFQVLAHEHTSYTSENIVVEHILSGQIKGPPNQCVVSGSGQQQMNGKKRHQARMDQSSSGEFVVSL